MTATIARASVETHQVPSHRPLRHAHHVDPEAARLALAEEEALSRMAQEHRRAIRQRTFLAGRLLLAGLFVASGAAKLFTFSATVAALEASGLSAAPLLLSLAIMVELGGGLMLGLGYRTRQAAQVLVGFLAVVTLFMHSDLSDPLNRAFALSNLAFAGGLLLLVANGPGRFSLERVFDKALAKRRA